MKATLGNIALLSFIASICAQNCDILGVRFAEYLGCEAEYNNNETKCPSNFICPKFDVGPGFCIVAGKRYSAGDSINGTHGCNHCFCSESRRRKCQLIEPSKMTCVWANCRYGEINETCWYTRKLDSCCSEQQCTDNSNVTCEVNGITYKEGEFFRPQNTCWECTCSEGFKGIYEEPYCMRTICDTEQRYFKEMSKKCAPVYYSGGAPCCPNSFVCPADIKNITKKQTIASTGPKCVLGKKTFSLGDELIFEGAEKNYTCNCNVPPMLTCYVLE